ncbi:MerR family transcriptional regulator [Bacillus suaedaesalsae]|uniref:MerR family transcriptional regulator n=1 Tax=Bacillus suaedaesalsae TaxID=2810349 RepID=A0ABS2DN00_9BACI|nr:MerR family transcriptional regulator [Bacillus suaedaesalsae]MBM6619895.1 MerR family transcriptional regulator [Bacillus suaedaesalsae]
MSEPKGKYNIKAVSQMLGIQAGTLRAWERRYHIIAPVRNEAGHRLYTEEHVKLLKWLIQKINKGFTISQAINLLENSGLITETSNHSESEGYFDDELADKLLDALMHFDENSAHEYLNQAFSFYSIDKVVIDILGAVLVRTGDLWERKKITSAHEHFASSFLRSRIGNIMHSLPTNSYLPKVVAVCGPNELHEFGLLIFTLYLRRKGYEVVYLGGSIAPEDVDIVLKEVNPKFLFLSCTLGMNLPETLILVDRLINEFPTVEIGVGGNALQFTTQDQKDLYQRHIVGNTKAEWDSWLESRM